MTEKNRAAKQPDVAVEQNNNQPRLVFQPEEYVVYPSHGVGRVVALEEREVAGNRMELIVISFEQERMLLRVPTAKVKTSGIRHLSSRDELKMALDVLRGRARVRRIMWSRRAQEYEAKINSGDVLAIAEVVRDLYKGTANNEQSYSERQLYEAALDRFTRELAVVESVDKKGAMRIIQEILDKRAASQSKLSASLATKMALHTDDDDDEEAA